jgi:hypothetical protein
MEDARREVARDQARFDIGRVVGAGEVDQAGAEVERRASPAR